MPSSFWSSLCQQAFENVKSLLCSAPVQAAPRLDQPFKLQVDASHVGAGAVLMQSHSHGINRPSVADLLSGVSPNTVIVPTSTSMEQLPPVVIEQQDAVDTCILAQCIDTLCDRFKHSYPSRSCMREVLKKTDKVSYFTFLMSLTKDDAVNHSIGVLPGRAELLIDPEMDQELDKLIAQISVSPGSNSSGSAVGGLRETQRRASPRRNIHHRRKMEMESDGSTEETDSSEN
ncbi:hypothetical protein LDENG_00135670 [Lucifuga dentata]|nr:hypothetical protein LDENG_00135670 [Lucifuga dentata]